VGLIDYSTQSKNLMEKHSQWHAVTGQSDMRLYDDGVEAAIRGGDAGAVRICRVSLGRHRVLNENMGLRKGGGRQFKFVFQEAGECVFEQDSRQVTLKPNEWCMYDKARPYHIHNDGFSRQLALMLPVDDVREDLTRWEDHLLRVYPIFEGIGHILHDSLNASIVELASLPEASRYLVGKTLTSLAELTLLDRAGIGGGTSSLAALRNRVIEYIDRNLDDPELDIDGIAAAMQCSKRYLHKVFAEYGQTVSKSIWDRRIERSYVDLLDPAMVDRTITDIAFARGFNDSHHFSRTFKRRYHVTPRDFRRVGRSD